MDEMNPHVYCLLTLQYSAVRLPHSSGSKCELFRLNLGKVVFTRLSPANVVFTRLRPANVVITRLSTAKESVWFSIGSNSCATTDGFSQIPLLLFFSSLQLSHSKICI